MRKTFLVIVSLAVILLGTAIFAQDTSWDGFSGGPKYQPETPLGNAISIKCNSGINPLDGYSDVTYSPDLKGWVFTLFDKNSQSDPSARARWAIIKPCHFFSQVFHFSVFVKPDFFTKYKSSLWDKRLCELPVWETAGLPKPGDVLNHVQDTGGYKKFYEKLNPAIFPCPACIYNVDTNAIGVCRALNDYGMFKVLICYNGGTQKANVVGGLRCLPTNNLPSQETLDIFKTQEGFDGKDLNKYNFVLNGFCPGSNDICDSIKIVIIPEQQDLIPYLDITGWCSDIYTTNDDGTTTFPAVDWNSQNNQSYGNLFGYYLNPQAHGTAGYEVDSRATYPMFSLPDTLNSEVDWGMIRKVYGNLYPQQ